MKIPNLTLAGPIVFSLPGKIKKGHGKCKIFKNFLHSITRMMQALKHWFICVRWFYIYLRRWSILWKVSWTDNQVQVQNSISSWRYWRQEKKSSQSRRYRVGSPKLVWFQDWCHNKNTRACHPSVWIEKAGKQAYASAINLCFYTLLSIMRGEEG